MGTGSVPSDGPNGREEEGSIAREKRDGSDSTGSKRKRFGKQGGANQRDELQRKVRFVGKEDKKGRKKAGQFGENKDKKDREKEGWIRG